MSWKDGDWGEFTQRQHEYERARARRLCADEDRKMFAAAALTGLLAGIGWPAGIAWATEAEVKLCAKRSIQLADEMLSQLAAREETGGEDE